MTIAPEPYKRALDAAIREYEELGRKRAEIDQRLAQLAQSIGVLTRLCGFVPTVSLGLTDGCRLVLRGAGVPLTALEVRDKLAAIGFDWSKYSNELASIHTVLKRLNESGEIRLIPRLAGQHAYLGQHPPTVVGVDREARVRYVWQHPPTASPLTKAEIDAFLEERSRRGDKSVPIERSSTNQPEADQAAEPAPAVQEETSRPKTSASETAAGGRPPADRNRRRPPVRREKKTK